jgi:hypothetical protein
MATTSMFGGMRPVWWIGIIGAARPWHRRTPMERYIGLDAHASSCTLAVMPKADLHAVLERTRGA